MKKERRRLEEYGDKLQEARRLSATSIALSASTFLAALTASSATSAGKGVVFWASDPIRPGETVLVYGHGFDAKTTASLCVYDVAESRRPLPADAGFDWNGATMTLKPLMQSPQCVKFALPDNLPLRMYALLIRNAQGDGLPVFLNRATLLWAQGEGGQVAYPGGWLRVFGRNICLAGGKTQVLLRPASGKAAGRILGAEAADCWNACLTLPANLAEGDYEVLVHNGHGGDWGWSVAKPIRVEKAKPWPATLFNVRDNGALGDGQADDTKAIQATVNKAGEAGGGVVFFPRGRYKLTEGLVVPKFVTLRGQKRELVNLFWPDLPAPLPAVIKGTTSFAVEDLTIYCTSYVNVIESGRAPPDTGDVHLRRLRVRAMRYMGHLKPEEVDARFRNPFITECVYGGHVLRLAGPHIEVVDCDLFGSGSPLWMPNAKWCVVARNQLRLGRLSSWLVAGAKGVIFENNQIEGGDLMSWGGGIGNLDGSLISENVYFAHNRHELCHGGDREAMTSDGSGGAYCGKVASVSGSTVVLPPERDRKLEPWVGGAFFILQGTGKGQYRVIKSASGDAVELARAFDIPPDDTSLVSITWLHRDSLFIGNESSDVGITIQLYGISINETVAENRCTRGGGFHAIGMKYYGYQPSWFVQFLDNEILEGNCYRFDHDNCQLSGNSHLGIHAWPPGGDWNAPLNLGQVARRNRLYNNALIEVGVMDHPTPLIEDAVVEGNVIAEADVGIRVCNCTAGILLRRNRFRKVLKPIDDPAGRAVVEK